MSDHVTDYVRLAGIVKRYHAWPTIQVQTIGEHSWQVALIYEQIFGELSSPVEEYIRKHDVAELITGDIPFPVKMENPALKVEFAKVEDGAFLRMGLGPLPTLHANSLRKIKICDLLEMMVFGMMERELGNLLAIPIIIRTKKAALVLADRLEVPEEFGNVCKFVDAAEARHSKVLSQHEKE
jgi:hypothetical protein